VNYNITTDRIDQNICNIGHNSVMYHCSPQLYCIKYSRLYKKLFYPFNRILRVIQQIIHFNSIFHSVSLHYFSISMKIFGFIVRTAPTRPDGVLFHESILWFSRPFSAYTLLMARCMCLAHAFLLKCICINVDM
jgi:hypothetical protein